jgi:hypothetical protein
MGISIAKVLSNSGFPSPASQSSKSSSAGCSIRSAGMSARQPRGLEIEHTYEISIRAYSVGGYDNSAMA